MKSAEDVHLAAGPLLEFADPVCTLKKLHFRATRYFYQRLVDIDV